MTRAGKKRKKPSHERYVAREQRTVNKLRRILKFNGPVFLAQWKTAHGIK